MTAFWDRFDTLPTDAVFLAVGFLLVALAAADRLRLGR